MSSEEVKEGAFQMSYCVARHSESNRQNIDSTIAFIGSISMILNGRDFGSGSYFARAWTASDLHRHLPIILQI